MTTHKLTVRVAEARDAETWNAFLEGAPDGNFYQLFEWAAVNREGLGLETRFLMASDAEGGMLGAFPLVRVRSRLFGDILASMPFVNFGGPAALDPEAEQALVDEACRHADDVGCDYLEIRTDRQLGALPTKSDKVSMTVPLDPDPDVVWMAFKSKHRSNIKSVHKNGIEVRAGGEELLDDFYRLMELSWRSLGTPLYARSYFQALFRHLGPRLRIFVAYHEGTAVATALNGHFRGTVEGMWAGLHPDHRKLQANYALYWDMIRDACERGFESFHLGRSTVDSPAASWKERWTAEPTPLHWNYHLVRRASLPQLNPNNPKYDLAIRAWRRLPLAVTRIIGPRLARSLP